MTPKAAAAELSLAVEAALQAGSLGGEHGPPATEWSFLLASGRLVTVKARWTYVEHATPEHTEHAPTTDAYQGQDGTP